MEREIKEKFLNTFDRENTVRTYGNQIDLFYKFVEGNGTVFDTDTELLQSIDFDTIEKYKDTLVEEGLKKATINLKIKILNEFFKYAMKRRIIEVNYTDVIKYYKQSDVVDDKGDKYVPSFDEIEKLIKQTYKSRFGARKEEFISCRDRLIIGILCTTGMRIQEVLGMTMAEIEKCDGYYMINIPKSRDKGKKGKRLPIVKSIEPSFLEYLEVREYNKIGFETDLLFFSKSGNPLEGRIINKNLKIYSDEVEAEGHITNHSFRHFLTKFLRKNGDDLSLIYKILGWSEKGIISVYDDDANSKKYDEIKLEKCDIFERALI